MTPTERAAVAEAIAALEDGLRLHEFIKGANVDGEHPRQLAKNIRAALASLRAVAPAPAIEDKSMYVLAKAVCIQNVAAASALAAKEGRQDYREFMTPENRKLDEAVQILEDTSRSPRHTFDPRDVGFSLVDDDEAPAPADQSDAGHGISSEELHRIDPINPGFIDALEEVNRRESDAGRDAVIKWTPKLEAARVHLCEFWLNIAGDKSEGGARYPELGRRAIETEQALTILGDIAVKSSAAIDPATVTQHQIEYAAQEVLHRRGFAFYDDPMEGGQDAYDISCEALEEVRIIVRALASAPSEAPKDETAWLIELHGASPTWWSLSDSEDGGEWSRKVDDALRFSREKDAQAYINDIGWTDVFACEHMWCDPRREAPKPPGQEPGGDPGVGRPTTASIPTPDNRTLSQRYEDACDKLEDAESREEHLQTELRGLRAVTLHTADRDAIREALKEAAKYVAIYNGMSLNDEPLHALGKITAALALIGEG